MHAPIPDAAAEHAKAMTGQSHFFWGGFLLSSVLLGVWVPYGLSTTWHDAVSLFLANGGFASVSLPWPLVFGTFVFSLLNYPPYKLAWLALSSAHSKMALAPGGDLAVFVGSAWALSAMWWFVLSLVWQRVVRRRRPSR
jgi:hypothetical protein